MARLSSRRPNPRAAYRPVGQRFAPPHVQPQSRTLSPVVLEFSFPFFGPQQRTLGSVILEYTAFNLNFERSGFGPVVLEYGVPRTAFLGDYEQARALGPVTLEYRTGGFSKYQPPSRKQLGLRQATVSVHKASWPRQRLAVLRGAHGKARSYVGMQSLQTGRQPGELTFLVPNDDPGLTADVLVPDNYIVVEQQDLPTWAGRILTIEENPATQLIEVSALDVTALLDAKLTPQSFEIKKSIGSNVIFRGELDMANFRNHTGILAPTRGELAPPIDQMQIGGQSVMESYNEITARNGYEWWVDIQASPRFLRFTARLGFRQGFDLSAQLHLYQGIHCSGPYKLDLSQTRQLVTTVSGFGTKLADRNSVSRLATGDLNPLEVGAAATDQSSINAIRRMASNSGAVRNEKLNFEVMTDSTGELSRGSERGQERPLAAGEMFNLDFLALADWSRLGVGSYFTYHSSFKRRPLVRVVHIIGLQPDEQMLHGVCEVPF